MASSASVNSLRATGVRRGGEDTSLSPVIVRKGPKPAVVATDGKVAGWFDAAVKCWGKGTAFADELGIGEAFLSEMRSGKRGVALRHLLPLLGHTEAVLAFVRPMLDSIGYQARPIEGPSLEDVLRLSHEESWEAPMFREHLYRVAEEKHGWTREQVDLARRGETK